LATPFGAFGERILSRATTVAFRAPVDVTERSLPVGRTFDGGFALPHQGIRVIQDELLSSRF
jgi:hypothetical protein